MEEIFQDLLETVSYIVTNLLPVSLLTSVVTILFKEYITKVKEVATRGRELINEEIYKVWDYKAAYNLKDSSLLDYYNHLHISAHKLFANFLIVSDYVNYSDVQYVNFLVKPFLDSPLDVLKSKIETGTVSQVELSNHGYSALGFLDQYQNILVRNANLSNREMYSNWKKNRKKFRKESDLHLKNAYVDVRNYIEKTFEILNTFHRSNYDLNIDNILMAHDALQYLDMISYYISDKDMMTYFRETYRHYRTVIIESDIESRRDDQSKVVILQGDMLQIVKELNKRISKYGNVIFNVPGHGLFIKSINNEDNNMKD